MKVPPPAHRGRSAESELQQCQGWGGICRLRRGVNVMHVAGAAGEKQRTQQQAEATRTYTAD